jgi:23S rRNA U2552 (ribose-2'-O)-methylase RlmE/FtsJ
MVLKVFEGEDLPDLIRAVKLAFHPVKVHTPAATRNESWESFIVARGFKGGR